MLYSQTNFGGRGLYLRRSEPNLRRWGFNNRSRSAHVSGRWQLCSQTYHRGRCRIGNALGLYTRGQAGGLIAATVGAILILLVYRWVSERRG